MIIPVMYDLLQCFKINSWNEDMMKAKQINIATGARTSCVSIMKNSFQN